MGFAKIEMSGRGEDYQWVDADRVVRIDCKPGNRAYYQLEGESHWVKTHMGVEELVKAVEEARKR